MSDKDKSLANKLRDKDFRVFILLYVVAIILGINMIFETIQAYKNI